MDYIGIIRQSFDLSWKYKLLWTFGFFASFLGGWSQIFKPEYRAQASDFLGNHPLLIIIIAIYTLMLLLFSLP
jgi:polyferredoxin